MPRLAAAIVLLLCCSTAHADTMVFTRNFSLSPPAYGTGDASVLLPQFFAADGTLESVEVQAVIWNANPSLEEVATFHAPASFTAELGADLSVQFGNLIATSTPELDGTFTGSGTLTGPNWSPFGATTTTDLQPFIGPIFGMGTLGFTLADTPWIASDNLSTAIITSGGTWNGTLILTYTFKAVPEPGSIVLIVIGLVGAGWITFRRLATK